MKNWLTNNWIAFKELFPKLFKKETYKGIGWFDYFFLFISIFYPIMYFTVFIFLNLTIYGWITLTLLLIGFPSLCFTWFKRGNKGK